uniref:Zinc finger protein 710-like n=1 Tax=Saccoglossus kowalevskii TaxID=10224 RepID=A0ABM0MPC3_SACKO|nr:PREDICTED: zinc finger protein 710-like [Saccoglossus kowalevskii]
MSFSQSRYLQQHMTTHADNKHQCQLCKQSFSQTSYLKWDTILRHTSNTPFHCQKCRKSFCVSSKLIQQDVQHDTNKTFVFQHPECHYTPTSKVLTVIVLTDLADNTSRDARFDPKEH